MAKTQHGPILGWAGNEDEIPAETRWTLRIEVATQPEMATVVQEIERVIRNEGYGLKYRLEGQDFGPYAVVVASSIIDTMVRAFHIGTMYVVPTKIELNRGDDFE